MEYSAPGGKLIHEKNQKQKSRDTVHKHVHTDNFGNFLRRRLAFALVS